MPDVLTVFLVDDHTVVREGLRAFLSIQDDLEVVGEAGDGADAVKRLKVMAASGEFPDVIVMDVQMPRMDGLQALIELRAEIPDATVLVLSSFVEAERVKALLNAGASGYLEKSSGAERVVEAVRTAAGGELYLDPYAARALAGTRTDGRYTEALSERELEIVALVAKGMSNQEIADELFISERTARTHVSHILMKLGLDSRIQAALWALRKGIVSIEDTR
jgi:DNA-binding NarL/FixJ family response regulator